MRAELPVLFEDDSLVVIDKPTGWLVHPRADSPDAPVCLATLRDQLGGSWLYPVHRLDRGTSGVLVFAKSPESASRLASQFSAHTARKTYEAIVRGVPAEPGLIDKPLRPEEGGDPVAALTRYEVIQTREFEVPVSKYPTSRYSWVRVRPETGRWHQIRRHFLSISSPLIGDTRYGEGRHNRFFRERFEIHRLCLCATALELAHPVTGAMLKFEAGWDIPKMAGFSTV